jgi:hypothetical protein
MYACNAPNVDASDCEIPCFFEIEEGTTLSPPGKSLSALKRVIAE